MTIRRFRRWAGRMWHGHRATIGFVVLTVAMALGLLRVETIARQLDLEAERRVETACQAIREGHQAIVLTLELLVSLDTDVSSDEQLLIDIVAARLADQPCTIGDH